MRGASLTLRREKVTSAKSHAWPFVLLNTEPQVRTLVSRSRICYGVFICAPSPLPGSAQQCPPTEVRCMSSLHQDRPVVEGSTPASGPGSTEQKNEKIPGPRLGKAQRT